MANVAVASQSASTNNQTERCTMKATHLSEISETWIWISGITSTKLKEMVVTPCQMPPRRSVQFLILNYIEGSDRHGVANSDMDVMRDPTGKFSFEMSDWLEEKWKSDSSYARLH